MTDVRILPPHEPNGCDALEHRGRAAVVALSGGQDSTTCLYYAMQRYGKGEVLTVSFDYGQRHIAELACARSIARDAGVPNKVINVPAFKQLGDAALTNAQIDVEAIAEPHEDRPQGNVHAVNHGLPSTFVPGRNLVFLGLAAAYGIPRGADVVVTGICQQDRAGYPDCRREFAEAFVDTVRLAMDTPTFQLDAPLLHLDKAGTWSLAHDLGILTTIVNDTHTCYEGNRARIHECGRGCGECPACQERARGWDEYHARLAAA